MRRRFSLALLSAPLLAACSQTLPPAAALTSLTVAGEVPAAAGVVSAVRVPNAANAKSGVGDARRFKLTLPVGAKLGAASPDAWLAKLGDACRRDVTFTEEARVLLADAFELRRGSDSAGYVYDGAGNLKSPGPRGAILNVYVFSDRAADLSGTVTCAEGGAPELFTFDLHFTPGWNKANVTRRTDAGGTLKETWAMGRANGTAWTYAPSPVR